MQITKEESKKKKDVGEKTIVFCAYDDNHGWSMHKWHTEWKK